MSEIAHFGKTNFRNQEVIFGIKPDDRRRHMYVIGKTGMGKTNLLENLAVQDIQNGHGIAFVDPHGDTAEKLVSMIPSDRINDVIYFNPSDQNFPMSFNVMEQVAPEYRPLVASGLIGVFQKLWADSWGPRLEYILRNAILALLEYPGSTLLGVMRILVDNSFRKRVVARVTDPVVKNFWTEEFPKWNERVLQEVISPIQNKVGQFLTSSLIRNIVGQTKSSFDVRDIMDQRKILILNLSKGRIGEDNSALIGAMMITKIQLAAMGRVDTHEDDRKDFYLYVDEFQNFATESFSNILSEARKYRLNLILANQYIAQLDETVRDAIFGNAGTLITFRVGAADAEFLEKELEPVFTMNDIVNLPKYNIYLKLMIDGVAGDAFSATTLPPIERTEADSTDRAVAVSRERYAKDRQLVEEKIARWSGLITDEQHPPVQAQGSAPKQKPATQHKSARAARKSYEKTVSAIKEPTLQPHVPRTQKQQVPVQKKPAPSDRQQQKPKSRKTNDAQVQQPQKERKTYVTNCDTCDIEITVPFKPDGTRPTFCKDCFRDYQRALAKKRQQEKEAKEEMRGDSPDKKQLRKKSKSQKNKSHDVASNGDSSLQKKVIEHKSYVPQDQPLKLSQMQNVAPKKFKHSSIKHKVDLPGVRDMLSKVKDRNGDSHS